MGIHERGGDELRATRRLAPGDTIGLAVDVSERRIRVEVGDDGPGFDRFVLVDPSPGIGGWGLHLIERLSDAWGVKNDPNLVWFEVSVKVLWPRRLVPAPRYATNRRPSDRHPPGA